MPTAPNTLCTGSESHQRLAAQLVESVAGEMNYLGWFLEVVRAYPEDSHDWTTALQTAWSVQQALNVAEALLRADHTTGRPQAAGAAQAQAAA